MENTKIIDDEEKQIERMAQGIALSRIRRRNEKEILAKANKRANEIELEIQNNNAN